MGVTFGLRSWTEWTLTHNLSAHMLPMLAIPVGVR